MQGCPHPSCYRSPTAPRIERSALTTSQLTSKVFYPPALFIHCVDCFDILLEQCFLKAKISPAQSRLAAALECLLKTEISSAHFLAGATTAAAFCLLKAEICSVLFLAGRAGGGAGATTAAAFCLLKAEICSVLFLAGRAGAAACAALATEAGVQAKVVRSTV